MGSHSLALKPSKNDEIKLLVKDDIASSKWTKLHFLGADCGCSENIFKHLMARKPQHDINEKIFMIGKNELWSKELRMKGYEVHDGKMDEFSKKYSINAVPQLSILDEKKVVLYNGGYTTRRGPASAVEEDSILKDLRAKHETKERPIFGCLSGSINRKNADPLNLKY